MPSAVHIQQYCNMDDNQYSDYSDYSDSDSLDDVPLSIIPQPTMNKPSLPALSLAMPVPQGPAPTQLNNSKQSNTSTIQQTVPPTPRIRISAATASRHAAVSGASPVQVNLLCPAFSIQPSITHSDWGRADLPEPAKQQIIERFRTSLGVEKAQLQMFCASPLGVGAPGQPTQVAVRIEGAGFSLQGIEGLLAELHEVKAANSTLLEENKALKAAQTSSVSVQGNEQLFAQLNDVQAANKALEDENKSLQAALTSNASMMQDMYSDVRKFQEDIKRLNEQIRSLQEERVCLSGNNTRLEAMLTNSKQDSEHLKLELQNLREFTRKCDQDRYQLKSVLQGLQAQFRAVVYGPGGVSRPPTSGQSAPAPASIPASPQTNGQPPGGYSESFLSLQQQPVDDRAQQPTGRGSQQTGRNGSQHAACDGAIGRGRRNSGGKV